MAGHQHVHAHAGQHKPGYPLTSLTRTVTARIPTGMIGARPKPLPRAARRPSSTASSCKIGLVTGRSYTSSGLEKPFLGNAEAAILTSLMSGGLIVVSYP